MTGILSAFFALLTSPTYCSGPYLHRDVREVRRRLGEALCVKVDVAFELVRLEDELLLEERLEHHGTRARVLERLQLGHAVAQRRARCHKRVPELQSQVGRGKIRIILSPFIPCADPSLSVGTAQTVGLPSTWPSRETRALIRRQILRLFVLDVRCAPGPFRPTICAVREAFGYRRAQLIRSGGHCNERRRRPDECASPPPACSRRTGPSGPSLLARPWSRGGGAACSRAPESPRCRAAPREGAVRCLDVVLVELGELERGPGRPPSRRGPRSRPWRAPGHHSPSNLGAGTERVGATAVAGLDRA